MVQSQHWTNPNGLVYATRADGSVFTPNPLNIGVESELYTRFAADGAKDTSIEEWFAKEIDDPAATMIDYLTDPTKVKRQKYRGDPKKAEASRQVGYYVDDYVEFIFLPQEVREAISKYVSALLVRNPTYLAKLIAFHSIDGVDAAEARDRALLNMIYMHRVYRDKIRSAPILLSRPRNSAEYLYADGGLMVSEPWSDGAIPFDIHAPITPTMAIEVLPIAPAKDELSFAHICYSTNQGIARQNKIILGGAQRFVFSRQAPPVEFIRKNFGVPAPKNIGHRVVNGEFEVIFDPSRR